NYATSPQEVHVTLTRGTTALVDRQLTIGAGEAVHQVTPLERGADARLRAAVTAKENALAIDDEAFAWIERARPLAVTVVGQRTGWLAALLGRDPDVRATFVDPSGYQSGADSYKDEAAIVFDRWAPEQPPSRPALYFAPPAGTSWLDHAGAQAVAAGAGGGLEEKRPRWEQAGSHPVVRGVDPLTLKIEKARPYRSASLVPVARSTNGTPLVYVGDSPERRLVVVTFGPAESNLTSAPGFPVLVGNALEWLTRPVPYTARKPGIASFDNAIARVIGPGGEAIHLSRLNGVAFGVLAVPGLYVAEGGGSSSTIAVNAGDPQISNLTRTSVGPSAHALTVTAGGSSRPWWLYCAVAAFLLVLTEWWTWQRRITV
ncbi:MAG: hypothetical protein ABJC89_13425, partial [Acidobacteriota bacterium]